MKGLKASSIWFLGISCVSIFLHFHNASSDALQLIDHNLTSQRNIFPVVQLHCLLHQTEEIPQVPKSDDDGGVEILILGVFVGHVVSRLVASHLGGLQCESKEVKKQHLQCFLQVATRLKSWSKMSAKPAKFWCFALLDFQFWKLWEEWPSQTMKWSGEVLETVEMGSDGWRAALLNGFWWIGNCQQRPTATGDCWVKPALKPLMPGDFQCSPMVTNDSSLSDSNDSCTFQII